MCILIDKLVVRLTDCECVHTESCQREGGREREKDRKKGGVRERIGELSCIIQVCVIQIERVVHRGAFVVGIVRCCDAVDTFKRESRVWCVLGYG